MLQEERYPHKAALMWCVRPVEIKESSPEQDETKTTTTATTDISISNYEEGTESKEEHDLGASGDNAEKPEQQKKPKGEVLLRDGLINLPKYSPYQFININYFHNASGFAFLCDLITNWTTVANIVGALEILEGMFYSLDEEFAEKNIFDKIVQPLRELPYKISDEEIKVSKKEDFSKLLKLVEVINQRNY